MATHSHPASSVPEPTVATAGPPPWWRGRALRLGLTIGVIGFGVGLIAFRWDTYGETLTGAHPGWVAIAVLLVVVGNVLSTWLHREILAARGTRLAARDVCRMVLVPNVLKYVPGFVAQAASFYRLGRRVGIERRGIVALFVEAMWVTLAVTSALGAAALLVVDSTVPPGLTATVLAGSVLALVPAVRDRVLRLARVLPADATALGPLTVRPLLIAAMGVVALGLHGVALARAVGATDLTLFEAVAAFAGGWVVGLVVFVFPGGIGPREVAASLLLAEFTSPSAAVVLVVISRFATVLADVITGTTALLLPASRRSSRAEPARLAPATAAEAAGG